MFEEIKGVIRSRKSQDRRYNGQSKDKRIQQWSTKHSKENNRSSNTNFTKTRANGSCSICGTRHSNRQYNLQSCPNWYFLLVYMLSMPTSFQKDGRYGPLIKLLWSCSFVLNRPPSTIFWCRLIYKVDYSYSILFEVQWDMWHQHHHNLFFFFFSKWTSFNHDGQHKFHFNEMANNHVGFRHLFMYQSISYLIKWYIYSHIIIGL